MNTFGDVLKKSKANKYVVNEMLKWANSMKEATEYLYDIKGKIPDEYVGQHKMLDLIKEGCKQYLEVLK